MNKNLYRIIFSKAQGMMVVVAETVLSHSSNSGNTQGQKSTIASQDTQQPHWLKLNRSLQLTRLSTLCLLMSGVTLTSSIIHAQIIADATAPANQQAVILKTANGLPQINIQTPNAAGVSINVYSQFDVDKSGAVLNNSNHGAQTKLAGWVQGNPLLTQSASIILNEVNSANPSQLSGYLEVAGQRAQVIVANPNGINCNGCGFINASRATLTTGTPVFNAGNLESYRVNSGTITIGGQGLDGTTADYTDLIAHAIQINAGIWANQLNVITGANTVGAANTLTGNNIPVTPTASSATAPQFSVDVAALGGMYAGQITLIGTEAGVGVRNAGQIGTNSGDITITADGQLQNSGTMDSKGNTSISANSVSNSGILASNQNLTINGATDLNNSGTLAASKQLNISNTGTTVNNSQSTIYGGTGLNLQTNQLTNSGQIVSGGTAAITTHNNIDNTAGVIEGQRLALSATGDLNNQGGQIVQTGNTGLDLSATNLINHQAGVIGQPIVSNTNNTGTTTSGGTASSGTSSSSTGNSGSSTGSSSSSTSSSGGITLSNGTLQVAGTLKNTGGSILTVGNTNVTTQNLDNTGGQLSLGQLNITGSSFTNDQGQLQSTQNLTTQAAQFSNQSGSIAVGGTLNAQASQINNLKGSIQAGTLQLAANQLDNTQGILLQTATNSDATITVKDQLTQQNGQIESAGNLHITTNNLTGTQGQLITLGNLNLTGNNISLVQGIIQSNGQATLTGTIIDNTDGQIKTNQKITLNATTLTNVNGSIQSTGDVNLTVLGNLDNSAGSNPSTQNSTVGGNILSGGALNIAVSGLLNNYQGTLGSVGTATTSQFNIQTQSLDNEQGLILQANNTQANNALTIATPYAQQDGQIQTQGNLTFTTPSLTLNNQALTVLGNLNLNSGAANLSNSTLYIGGDASLNTADLNNDNGNITAKGGLNITSNSIENIGGVIQSNGSMTIQTTGLLNNALLGQILSAQDININAQGINNVDGTIAGNSVDINTNGLELVNYYGSILANGNLSLNTGAIANDAGLLQASKDLNINTNGQVISNTDSPQNAESTISQSVLPLGLFAPAYFTSNNMGLAYQYLGPLTDPLITTNFQGVSTLNQTVSYDYNGITATFNLIPNTTGPNQIDAGDGNATTTNSPAYQLTGLTLDNNLLPPDHSTGILSGTGLNITSGLLNNTNGAIATQGSLNFNIAGLINTSGLIQSTKDLSINITPNAFIPFTTFTPLSPFYNLDDVKPWNKNTNYKGKIESTTGSISITDLDHTFWNGLGLISAAKDINLNLQSLINASIYYNGNDGNFYNQGGTIVANNISVITAYDIVNAGNAIIAANNNINLDTDNSNISQNQTYRGLAPANQGGNIQNYDSLIQAGQTLTINTHDGTLDNEHIYQSANSNLGLIASTIQLQNVDTLQNTSNIYSKNTLDINVNSLWAFDSQGSIATSNDLNITANNFLLFGSFVAKNNISLTETQAGAWFDNAGQINAQQGQVDIQANQTRFGNDGQIVAGTNINVNALGLFNNGVIYAPNIQLEANLGSLDNSANAKIVASNTLNIDSGVLTNDSGLIQAGQALSINTNGQDLTNTNDTAATSTNPLGIIATNLQLQNISTLDNSNGIIYTPNSLNLDLTRLKNLGGNISSGDQLTLTTSGPIYNMRGSLVSANDLQITSDSLINNAGGQIGSTTGDAALSATHGIIDNTANGQITSATNVNLNSQGLNNGGVIYAPNVQIETNNQALNNTQGGAIKGNTLSVNSGELINDASLIQAEQRLQINTNEQNIYNNNDQNATITNPLGIIGTSLLLQNLNFLYNSGIIYTPNTLNLNLVGLVNEGGNITTSSQFNINATDSIYNGAGTLSAGNAIQFTGLSINNDGGRIGSTTGDISLTATQDAIENTGYGQIISPLAITLNSQGLYNDGIISASGIQIEANHQAVSNTQGGTIVAGDTLSIDSGLLTNDASLLQGQTLTLNTNGQNLSNTNDQASTATNPLGIIAPNLQLQNIAALDNSKGIISAKNSLNLAQLTNQGGSITSQDRLTVNNTGTLNNAGGSLVATNAVQLTGASIVNAGGQIGSITGDITLKATQGVIDNTAHGKILSKTSVSLDSQGLNNGGVIYAPNVQIETHNLALNNTQGGSIAANTVSIDSGALSNDASLIQAAQTLKINTNGQNLSNTNDQASTAANPLGIIAPTLQLQNIAALDNSQGTIYSPNSLNLNLTQLTNQSGSITSGDQLTINTTGSISNTQGGKIIASNTLSIDSGYLNNDSGLIQGGQSLTINTHGADLINTNTLSADPTKPLGLLSNGDVLLNQIRVFNNTSGSISTGQQLTLNAVATYNSSNALITSLRDINISGGTLENLDGQIEANGTLNINMSNRLDNEGLINATTTLISAGTVYNASNGKIYGDKVAINAQTLENTPLYGTAPVIAARQDMELGVQILNNNPNVNPNTILGTNNGAMILSLGNLNIGGSLDSNNNATGQAQQVNNLSATIQSVGNMNINTANLLNKDMYFAYVPVVQSSVTKDYWILNSSIFYQEDYGSTFGIGVSQAQVNLGQLSGSGQGQIYVDNRSQGSINTVQNNTGVQLWSNSKDSSLGNLTYAAYTVNGITYQADNYTEFRTTQTVTQDQLTVKDSAQILAGGNLNLLGNTLTTNQNSQIIVGGNLIANLNNLQNIATQGTTTTSETGSYDNSYPNRRSCCHDRTLTTGWLAYHPADVVTTSQIIGTGSFQPLQTNTASQSNGTSAGNAANAQQQGLAYSNGSTSVTAHNASGSAAQSNNTDYSSDGFANRQSTIVQAISASLIPQSTAVAEVLAQSISEPPSLIQPANDDAPSLAPALTPAQISQQINRASVSSQSNTLHQPSQISGVLTTLPHLTLPQIALYQINSSPTATYIVETDPKFLSPTSTSNLASANTLLQDLQTTSNITQKQIGDAFYQQQLINQQIGALTGKAFISGYNTTNSEYAALLTNGATFAKQQGLTVGVGLTAAQMAQLTSDIVWLVSEPVTLPNGTVENALVPQVYLLPQAGNVSSNGALISANQIQMNTTGNVTNSGTIAGEQAVVINANNISNTGNIAGTQIGLTASNDLSNMGGTISADQNLILKAGNDINISSTTDSSSNTFGLSSSSQTSLDRIAGIYLSNSDSGGQLLIAAGNDLNVNGAQISNQSTGGLTNLIASNTINIDPLQLASQLDLVRNSSNYTNSSSTTDFSSSISSAGNLNINAGGILSAIAAQIYSGGDLSLSGGQGVLIANGYNTSTFDSSNTYKSHGFLGGTSGVNQTSTSSNTVLGSTLNADGTLSINSQSGDILSIASLLNGQTINLSALNGQVSLDSANSVLQSSLLTKETSRNFSLGGLLAGGMFLGGASAFDPTKDQGQAQNLSSTAVVNQLNAGSGGINIQAQGDITSQGTDLTSGGNITLTSTQGQVLLQAVQNLIESQSANSSIGAQLNHMSSSSTMDQTVQMSQMQYTGQLIVNAAQGIHVDLKTDQGASTQNIQSVINGLAQQPGMAWLQQMQANGQIDYNQIQQIYQQQSQSSTSLGLVSNIMIAIAVTVATAGTGTSAVVAAESAAEASLITAGITDTANSLMSGQGLNGALNTFFSKKTLQNATAAALTAGISQGVTNSLGISNSTLVNVQGQTLPTWNSMGTVFEKNLINSVSGALVNQVVYGGNLGQNLTQAGVSAVGNTVGAIGFDAGANYVLDNNLGQVGGITLATVHGITGALTGYIIGGTAQSALAGASSAFVTELATPFTASLTNGNNTALFGINQAIGGLTALAVTGNGSLVGLGENVAGLETQYNWMLHQQDLPSLQATCAKNPSQAGCATVNAIVNAQAGTATSIDGVSYTPLLDANGNTIAYKSQFGEIYSTNDFKNLQSAGNQTFIIPNSSSLNAIATNQNVIPATVTTTAPTSSSTTSNSNSFLGSSQNLLPNPTDLPYGTSNSGQSSSDTTSNPANTSNTTGTSGTPITTTSTDSSLNISVVNPATLTPQQQQQLLLQAQLVNAVASLGLSDSDAQKIFNNLNMMAPLQQASFLSGIQGGSITSSNVYSNSLDAAALSITGQYMTPQQRQMALVNSGLMLLPVVGELSGFSLLTGVSGGMMIGGTSGAMGGYISNGKASGILIGATAGAIGGAAGGSLAKVGKSLLSGGTNSIITGITQSGITISLGGAGGFSGAVATNYIDNKPLLENTFYPTIVGATAPLISGEATGAMIVGSGVEIPKIAEIALPIGTGAVNIGAGCLDPNATVSCTTGINDATK